MAVFADATEKLLRGLTKNRRHLLLPAKVTAAYAVFAGLWILFSDYWIAHLFPDPSSLWWLSSAKGLVFVVFTSFLLFGLARTLVLQVQRSTDITRSTLRARDYDHHLLTELLDNSPDVIFTKDLGGHYTLVNREVLRVLGKPAEEVLGHTNEQLFAPGQATLLTLDDRKVMKTNATFQTVERLSLHSGDLTYLVTKGPLHDVQGRVNGVFGIAHDITGREQAKEELLHTLDQLRESEERYRALVEQNVVSIYIIQDGVFRYVNPGFARTFGYASPDEVIDKVAVSDLVTESDRELVRAQIARRIDGEVRGLHYFFTGQRKDGSQVHLEVHGQSFQFRGRPAVLGLVMDISERRLAEEGLRIAATAFEAQDGIIVTDARAVIQRVNKAFTRITGYSEAEALGRTPALLQSGNHDARFYAELWSRLAQDGYWQGELCNRHKNGDLFTERLTISAVKNEQGIITHYVGFLSDVTQQRDAESRAQRLAYFDSLTDLPNRLLLYDRLDHALSWSARSGQYCALMFVDLDNFKKINDTIGHHAGDNLLVLASQRMRRAVREGDTVARFGGDEFVILVEELGSDMATAAAQTGKIAEKVRVAMTEPYDLDGLSYLCTASIGATLFMGGGTATTEEILMHADLAMYGAKHDGRNAFRFFEENMQVELSRRTALEAEIRLGIEQKQFVLYYQPQFDRHGLALGAEALLRWNHPRLGLVAPNEFIALAEDTGLIVPLGLWVLEAACAQLALWAGSPSTRQLDLAVNVSARQFAQSDFVDRVLRALQTAGADPRRLKIELTESTVIEDVDDAFEKMMSLRRSGISFSLDDFGTGSSSLSYLTRLPLDQLKIDKSFVDDLPDDLQDATVAQTIIAMAKGLGLNVVAEGVETRAQWDFLMTHGCDGFQGYLLSTPVSVENLGQALRPPDRPQKT